MFGIIGYGGFLLSSILLNLTPGTDIIYVLSRSISGGRKCGVVSALGITSGILIHTVLVSLGLAAILAGSPLLFNALKIAGAAYLVIMGISTLLKRDSLSVSCEGDGGQSLWSVYRKGVLTNALNPKVLLFFLTLLPQFVSAENTFGPLPFLILGMIFFTTSTVWCLIIAYMGSFVSRLLESKPKFQTAVTKFSGIIYIALGLNVLR